MFSYRNVLTPAAILFLFVLPLTSTGCLPFIAGAAGGAAVSAGDNERVERYVATHDVSPRIAEAMYEGRVVQGMTMKQVRVTMTEEAYSCEQQKSQGELVTWDCSNEDPKFIGGYVVHFDDGKVVRYEEQR